MRTFKKSIMGIAAGMLLALSLTPMHASAAFKDDGPTQADFTVDGVFDQDGYIAALLAFENAPLLTIDRPITVSVAGCASGATITMLFVGHPASQVSVTSTGSPTSVVITPPAGIRLGYNVLRTICDTGTASTLNSGALQRSSALTSSVDVIVNLQPSGPGVASSLSVSLGSTPPGGGGLPDTGTDMRSMLGYGAAIVLIGAAVVIGARRRFDIAPAS